MATETAYTRRPVMFPGDWYAYVVPGGVDERLPGLYEWLIEGVGSYIGKYKSITQPDRQFARNVLSMLGGGPYRETDAEGFRRILWELHDAQATRRRVTLTILKNVDPAEIDEAEQALIRQRGRLNNPAYGRPWQDRARGALIGLAIGNALGTTLASVKRDELTHHRHMTGGGRFSLAPGMWTDDTSMALAMAESLVACKGFDPVDVMDRLVDFWRRGAYSPMGKSFDIDAATREALERYETTKDPFAGNADENFAGNDSLMRLAPVALRNLDDPDACRRMAAEQCRLTHAAPQAVEACEFFAELLRRAIKGEEKSSLLAPTEWTGHPDIRDIAAGAWRKKSRNEIRSSGYVVHTLEAALWAVDAANGFQQAVVAAVNLADDADSVGAVTGQLAGAIFGYEAIPRRWLTPLAWRPRLLDAADALVAPQTAAA